MQSEKRSVERTEYPHIVKLRGVCGGEAIVEGTRIAVWHIADYYYRVGLSVEEILLDWDSLAPAQVFGALAYYHDHREEIDRLRWENSYEFWKERDVQVAA